MEPGTGHAEKIADGKKTPAQIAAKELLDYKPIFTNGKYPVVRAILNGIANGTITVGSDFLAYALNQVIADHDDGPFKHDFPMSVARFAMTGACTTGQSLAVPSRGRAQE